MDALTPGTYYQDVLADGTRSKLRQNFKHLRRVSFDTKSAVVQTLQIEVTSIPLPELVLTPAQEEMSQLYETLSLQDIMLKAHDELLSKAMDIPMSHPDPNDLRGLPIMVVTKDERDQISTDLERLFRKIEDENSSL